MNTISQGFFDQLTTSRTHLARVAGVHENHSPTGTFRLVGCELHDMSNGRHQEKVAMLFSVLS